MSEPTDNELHCYAIYGGNPCYKCGKQMPLWHKQSWCESCLSQLRKQLNNQRQQAKRTYNREWRAKRKDTLKSDAARTIDAFLSGKLPGEP